MIQRNRASHDVRAGEVFVECSEKTGVRDFGFCAHGDSPVWQGRKRLPKRECSPQDQRMAVWGCPSQLCYRSSGTSKSALDLRHDTP